VNPFLVFSEGDGSFPMGAEISRDYMLEANINKLPLNAWFAVDAGTNGLIKSATHFPLAAVNGTFRWPGDESPIVCRLKDPQNSIVWVAAATKPFSGGATLLKNNGVYGEFREWTGKLDYKGGMGSGDFPLYFEAWSQNDIPTLSATKVHVDPGPFDSGPADSGCSQRNYDPARTCRSLGTITKPLTDWVAKPPKSASGLVLTSDYKIVRRLEEFRSLALQFPGENKPQWTRLVGESDTISSPAVGNEGTIFCLEPDQGLLRAIRPNGTERWTHSFTSETHGDLVLTSSPLGGLLITILRENGKDIAIVGVGTDGHLRWRFNLGSKPEGSANERRLAVGPGGTVFYTIPTGGVIALDLNGQCLWAASFPGWISTRDPVAGDDDQVLCIVNGGAIVACLSKSGAKIWTSDIPSDRIALWPSLSYSGLLFVVMEINGDTDGIRVYNGNTGKHLISVVGNTIRGYVVHGLDGDYAWIQRDPPGGGTCCDDFFISHAPNHTQNWFLNTPGVTQTGAYPVVDKQNDIYVQGPDGMYQVTL